MTRSAMSPYSPKVAKKAFRENAKRQGLTFRAAMEARDKQLKELGQYPSPAGAVRRNPGRMDGSLWNGSTFICPQNIDGPPYVNVEIRECESGNNFPPDHFTGLVREKPVISSLLDIAKPAKPKGIAKEFEVVRGLRRTIVLDDSVDGQSEQWSEDEYELSLMGDEDDEWEEIYDDGRGMSEHMSYAEVLKER